MQSLIESCQNRWPSTPIEMFPEMASFADHGDIIPLDWNNMTMFIQNYRHVSNTFGLIVKCHTSSQIRICQC